MYEQKQTLFATLDRQPLSAEQTQRLKDLQEERAQASQAFFAQNADKFRAQQDLIASYPVYAEQVNQLLANTPLPGNHLALEVGPGDGEFLPQDRKSTRLNSSHVAISYAVFCLKKK